jgi:LmbE family N-acetylglucosaminyl deacetylase
MDIKRLLAVWAHPDDEAFGPVGTMRLAHDSGWKTAIVTATRGEHGQLGGVVLSPGQTIGELREAELRCSSALLGVDRLEIWRYEDGSLSRQPAAALAAEVGAVLRDWQPAVVLTFGPDGITGHPDHIAISTATTAAFHRYCEERPGVPLRLYYVTLPAEREVRLRMGESPPPAPVTTLLDVARYAAVKRQALACHASQQSDWEAQLDNEDWFTTDRLFRAYPPFNGSDPEVSIFHE